MHTARYAIGNSYIQSVECMNQRLGALIAGGLALHFIQGYHITENSCIFFQSRVYKGLS